MSSTTSVYIPRVSQSYSGEMIAEIFYTDLGVDVSRIDFVAIEGNAQQQSMFVHFDYPTNGYFAQCVNPIILAKAEDENRESYRLQVTDYEFWWLLPNLNPVQDTKLNIHQIAENARLLEIRVQQLDAILMNQTNQIMHLQYLIQKQAEMPWDHYENDSMPPLISVEDLEEHECNSMDDELNN